MIAPDADAFEWDPVVEPESGVRLVAPAPGFTVHAKDGTVLATVACVLDACDALHALDAAETVRRVSDGALLNTKDRIKGGSHPFAWAWRLTREPERE